MLMNYMEWINRAEQEQKIKHDNDLEVRLNEIYWISNLTNCSEAQKIFEVWWNEMIKDTKLEVLGEHYE